MHPLILNGKPSGKASVTREQGRYAGPAQRGCRRLYERSPHFDVAGWQHVDNRGYIKI